MGQKVGLKFPSQQPKPWDCATLMSWQRIPLLRKRTLWNISRNSLQKGTWMRNSFPWNQSIQR